LKLIASSQSEISSPLVAKTEEKNILLVVLGTDRGLCGALNSNLFKAARSWLSERPSGTKVSLVAWGRKSISWAKRQTNETLIDQKAKVLERPNYQAAKALAEDLIARFTSGEYDAVYLIGNRFVNARTQRPEITKFLPIDAEALESKQANEAQ